MRRAGVGGGVVPENTVWTTASALLRARAGCNMSRRHDNLAESGVLEQRRGPTLEWCVGIRDVADRRGMLCAGRCYGPTVSVPWGPLYGRERYGYKDKKR